MAAAEAPRAPTDLSRVLAELYARVPRGARLGLEPMRAACKRFGNPERAFEVVHVAGTNGKGSTCAMVESIARAAGRRTGMYTSPHLCRFAERIRIAGEPISDEALVHVLDEVLRVAPELSFFETATLAAFVAFREAKVDLAIVEVGLGGRLDATNVIPPPRAAAITRIAFDHMDRLGNTLVEIAREKAGIAKPGVDLLLGERGMPQDVYLAIAETARTAGGTATRCEDTSIESFLHAFAGATHLAPYAPLELAFELGRRIGATDAQCAEGIAAAQWPARYETIEAADGPYLLDAAHNPDGARALARSLDTVGVPVAPRKLPRGLTPHDAQFSLVFGALSDKAWPEMIDVLAPLTQRRVYVAPPVVGGGRGPAPPADMARRHPGETSTSVVEALGRARAMVGPGGVVVVCGSIFLVGEARAHLLGLERDPPVAL